MRQMYFDWLCGLVCGERYSKQVSFDKLLHHLYSIEFKWVIRRDQNRAEDGIDLRWRFANEVDTGKHPDDVMDILDGPCSMLEMMIALSIRCEETIMDDPRMGDRTGQWFWGMIVNLGLGSMIDSRFNVGFVDEAVDIFLNREYEPDGHGGLFTIKDCQYDLRDVEIWTQLCWYLDDIM